MPAAFFAAAVWLLCAGPLPGRCAVPTDSYERHIQPAPLPPDSRALAHVVRAFGHRRGLHLGYDWRLMQAARCQLQFSQSHPDSGLQLGRLRACAQGLGWTDGELSAVQVSSRARALPQALAYELDQTLTDSEATAMGLAVGPGPMEAHAGVQTPLATVVVALSRRLLRLSPVPRRRPVGSHLVLTGTLADRAITRVTASLQCPQGQVVTVPLAAVHGHFMGTAGVGPVSGTLQVELLVERGFGPQVAATFPVSIGPTGALTSTTQPPGQIDSPLLAPTQEPTVADVLALVWGARASHTQALPTVNQNLMIAAQNHATEMAQKHFFAHISPTTGDVTQRLKALGEPFVHVVENIASDRDVTSAFAQWQQSPGHLANLLDSRVTHVGVGLAATQDATPQWLMVLVMTQQRP